MEFGLLYLQTIDTCTHWVSIFTVSPLSAKGVKQEDSDHSKSDLSCDSDEEWLPSIEENKKKQSLPGMLCLFCFESNLLIRKTYVLGYGEKNSMYV